MSHETELKKPEEIPQKDRLLAIWARRQHMLYTNPFDKSARYTTKSFQAMKEEWDACAAENPEEAQLVLRELQQELEKVAVRNVRGEIETSGHYLTDEARDIRDLDLMISQIGKQKRSKGKPKNRK